MISSAVQGVLRKEKKGNQMKKLLTTIAIVAVATITHAASVSWSATSVKDINGASAKNIAEEAGGLSFALYMLQMAPLLSALQPTRLLMQ